MAGVNLRVATLKDANMQNCDLRSAVLAGADLEVSLKLTFIYGSKGCVVFKWGYKIRKIFALESTYPTIFFLILRIGLKGSLSSLQKSEFLKF